MFNLHTRANILIRFVGFDLYGRDLTEDTLPCRASGAARSEGTDELSQIY